MPNLYLSYIAPHFDVPSWHLHNYRIGEKGPVRRITLPAAIAAKDGLWSPCPPFLQQWLAHQALTYLTPAKTPFRFDAEEWREEWMVEQGYEPNTPLATIAYDTARDAAMIQQKLSTLAA